MDNIGYLSAVKFNPFGSAAINPTTRVFYGTDYYARAWSNTIAYYLRTDGWLFGVQHAPKNDTSAAVAAGNRGGAKTSATVGYGAGPLTVSLGYESNKDNLSAVGEAKSWALHGSYDFGVAKVYAGYGTGKVDLAVGQDVGSKGYHLGASVPVGQGAFLVSYATGELKADNTSTFASGTKFRDVKSLAVGYSHHLSKRTSVYVAYLDEQDRYPVAGPANALNNLKLDTKQLSLGIRHSF
jgi:predicted porin